MGLRVVIVEDRELIAAKIRRALVDAGYDVIGKAPTVYAAALQLHEAERLDAAVLDIDLRGEPVYPVAELLDARWIPFIFLTGYGAFAVDDRWSHVHRVEKPFETASLLRALDDAIRGVAASGGRSAKTRPSAQTRLALEMIRDTRDAITEARAAREMQANASDRPPR